MTAGDFDFLQRADIDSMSNHYEQAIAIDANFAASWLTTSLTQTERPRDPRWFWLGVARDAIGDSCGAVGAYNHARDNVEDAAYRLNASQVKCTAS
jgi:hypothetical protein